MTATRSRSSRILVPLLMLLLAASLVPAQEAEAPEAQDEETSLWEDVQALYEKAKATGEQVPKDAYEWMRQDLQNIGDWEYLVVELARPSGEQIQEKLNELGAERWDCFWIDRAGESMRFLLRRPTRTYIQHIPLSQLMKLIPLGESDSPSE